MKDSTLFVERLEELMQEKEINIFQLSKEINCDNQAIARWMQGKYFPRYYVLISLSNFFDCSIDFLLGRTLDEERYLCNEISNFHERFYECLIKNNLTAYKVSKLCNISQSTITKWTKHGKMPETSTLILLADLFNCTIDFLLGFTKK